MENWLQNYDPLGNALLSTIVAALPVVVLLTAIAFFHIRIHLSALLGLAPEEVDELYRATRTVLPAAIETLRERVPPTFEKQVRDFLAVHDKGGQPCPRCGTRITEVRAGGFITSFCRGCQR